MERTAKLKHLHIAPRKVRLVADLIRGKSVESAQNILKFVIKRGGRDLERLLKSGAAAFGSSEKESLYIKKIFVDEGPKYKRWMPRARGQAYEIQKKTSHVTLVLEDRGEKEAKAGEAQKEAQVASAQAKKAVAVEKLSKAEKTRLADAKKPRVEKTVKRFFRRKAI